MLFFRNMQVFTLATEHALEAQKIQDALAARPFMEASSQQSATHGFVPPATHTPDLYAVPCNGALLVCLRTDEKILPGSVVSQETEKEVKRIETEENRKVGRRESKEIKERVIEAMLPRALSKTSHTRALLDLEANRVIVDCSSHAKAENLLSILRETIGGGLPTRMLSTSTCPATAMQAWLLDKEQEGQVFKPSMQVELATPGNEQERKAKLKNFQQEEIQRLIEGGMVCRSLELDWDDRMSFVLTGDLGLKRVTLLDRVQDALAESDAQDQAALFDAELFLLVSESRNLLNDLVEALGGLEQ